MASWDKVAGGNPSAEAPRHPNDYYPTPPAVTRVLLEREEFEGPILEPCAGAGHVVQELSAAGYHVFSNEPFEVVQGFRPDTRVDWLTDRFHDDAWRRCRSLATNPPYRKAEAFIRRAIGLGIEKHAWLLRFQFVEGARRWSLFHEHPPRRLWVFSKRVQVSERGLENPIGGMIVYTWWIWERGYKGHPELRWIEPDAVVDSGSGNR